MNPFDKDPSRDYVSPKRAPVPLIAGMIVAVVLGLGIALVAFSSAGDGGSGSGSVRTSDQLASSAGPDEAPTQPPAAPTPEPTPPPPPEPTPIPPPPEPTPVPQLTALGSGDRISIPRFGVNAPLTYKTVSASGQMPDPDGTDDVAYYNFPFPGFGGAPGQGGNAVFAGHVDSGSKPCNYGRTPAPCGAVFWDLAKVNSGDEIHVQISGTVYRYRVTGISSHSESADWQPIVSATAKETITIITCGGNFNQRTRSYDQRQVVKAERI